LQHALHLAQRGVLVGDVAQAEGDGDQVEAASGNGSFSALHLHVLEAAHHAAVGHAVAADASASRR
jgi:hypothetical protein